jgi:UDP-N-acetylglucosamine 3-dehydrogenase
MSDARGANLRGVVVGLGNMGSHHARILRTLDGVDLTAVVDPDAERRAAITRTYAGVGAYGSLAEALAREQLDFACVAIPVGGLPGATGEALGAGLHVLVEKPTAPTEDEAAAMIADADARGLLLGVGHIERWNPAVVAMKQRIDEGAIGRVRQVHARRLSPYPNRQGSQGVALDLATHDIDVMRYVTGEEVARVFAETASPLSADGNEDILCATLRLDDGTMGLLESNWMTPTKVRQISVLGEQGMLVVDYLTQDLMLYEHPTRATEWDALAGIRGGGEGNMIRFALDRREPLRVQWEEFLGAIRDGRPAPVSGADGLAALSTARAIRSSAARGETVVPAYRQAVPGVPRSVR